MICANRPKPVLGGLDCANCTSKVVGGPKYSRESVLCQACADAALARHERAVLDLYRLRAENSEPTFLQID